MPWFKVDDGLFTSRKVLSIPRSSRMQAMGLWCVAGAWAARELSDGFVPAYVVTELGATTRQADVLVNCGLWESADGGYKFHDWVDYQPTRVDTERQRESARERMRKLRGSSREQDANTDERSGEVRDPSVRDSRPVPSRPEVPSELSVAAAKRATQLPAHWVPNQNNIDYAAANGIDLEHQVEQFKSHHLANGSTFKNWDQAFRKWLGNAKAWAKPSAAEQSVQPRQLYFTPPPPPEDMPPALFTAWNLAHSKAHRDGRPGPQDWREVQSA
jgi:hypothetical protein